MTEYYNKNKQKTKIKKIKGNNYHMKTSTSFYREGDNDICPRMVRFCACVICF